MPLHPILSHLRELVSVLANLLAACWISAASDDRQFFARSGASLFHAHIWVGSMGEPSATPVAGASVPDGPSLDPLACHSKLQPGQGYIANVLALLRYGDSLNKACRKLS